MPPSRRQPPRSSTPPARRPKVAGLRKPSDPAAPAASPTPRPRPRPLPDADPAEVTQELRIPRGGLARPAEPETEPAETEVAGTAVEEDAAEPEASAVAEKAPAEEIDALTGETVEEEKPARPSPRRKKRDTGSEKPSDVEEAETKARTREDAAAAVPAQRSVVSRNTVRVALLLVVGLALVAAAVIFQVKGSDAADSTSNRAVLDVAKTAQVKDQVSKAIETLFSYDFNNIKKTEDAANQLLATDQVKASYNALMGQVKKLAPEQKVVVTCKVTRSAVIRLNGDLARVMLFIDQTSTRADTKQTAAGTAQMHVDAQLQGNTWKITDMDTYKAAGPAAGAPAPSAPASAPPSK
ncbi:Mce-associated membrane protein [Amycolatopsis echigonensis]|uniref:Mce-associated membrane protein n=1 Tax=Amycolatopsis echigonensis TaxID=2576905 RepID=A0A2N3WE59_9PSEU|nr:hypothetical protein [Amycolatopsis niigatensis]PKV92137.1 Mce-associated membrane protein [Amycolatopsis niigatensis]